MLSIRISKKYFEKRSKSRFELDLKVAVEKAGCTVYNYDKAHWFMVHKSAVGQHKLEKNLVPVAHISTILFF